MCHRITISLSCDLEWPPICVHVYYSCVNAIKVVMHKCCKMLYPHKPRKFISWCVVSVLLILCAMEAMSDLFIIIFQESRYVGVLDNLPNQSN